MKAIEKRIPWRNASLRQSLELPKTCTKLNVHSLANSYLLPVEHPQVMAYIASCQPGNPLIYVSPQIVNLGFPTESWLTETNFRLQKMHAADFEHFNQALSDSHSSGQTFDCCYRLYDGGGAIHWFHDRAELVCDDSGDPLFISGAMLEITEKMKMQEELTERRYCLERMVEQRTLELLKRMTLLESCNASLCDKLAFTRQKMNNLVHGTAPTTDNDRSMIVWRVAAAGEIA